MLFGDKDGILEGGFHANASAEVSELRVKKLQERSVYSNYLVLPTKFSFPKVVRIHSYVMCFIRKARKGEKMIGNLLKEAGIQLSMFIANIALTDPIFNEKDSVGFNASSCVADINPIQVLVASEIDDIDIQAALLYLFRKGSAEVVRFNTSSLIKKIAFEKEGILFSKDES